MSAIGSVALFNNGEIETTRRAYNDASHIQSGTPHIRWWGHCQLPNKERDRALRHVSSQAAATAARHVFIAAARKIRCARADARWRWTLKVL
jgi:hypothetical protein